MFGKICADHRRNIGFKQKDVADDLGYTISNISKFEHDQNMNYIILSWYIDHGLDLTSLIKE